MPEKTTIDFTSAEFKADPYPTYKRLATQNPILPIQSMYGQRDWIVTGYDLALTVLKDSRFIKDFRKLIPGQADGRGGRTTLFANNLLNFDPPEHTRLRAVVSKAFTPRLVENLRPRIQQIADELLDKVQSQGKMELISDYAFPLPIIVICEMLGIPHADRDKFREWSNVVLTLQSTPEHAERFATAIDHFVDYLHKEFEARRQQPKDDLITALLQAESDGQSLSQDELYAMVILLIIAGHETTVNLIGNGILALLLHPDQLQKLKENPTLIKNAVEEFLRYNGPVEWATARWAGEDLELGGEHIRRGERVHVILGAADHDPSRFTSPDELNLEREISNHLAFGQGVHYCLGAPLARLEGQIAIPTLLARLPNLQLAVSPDQLQWRPSLILRGLNELPVTF